MGHVNSTSNKARALPKGAYIEVGSTGDLGITGGSYTVEAWVKFLAYSKDVVDQLDNTILGSDSQEALHIGLRDGRLHMGHYGDDTISTTRQPLGVWRHYAFVYDHVTTEQSIYVNGRRDAVSAGHKPLAGNTPLFIGRHAGGRSLLGEVSELRVWCTAVPEATLGSRVLQRVPDFEGRPHLVACWSQAASRGPRSVKLQPWELKGPVGNETPLPGGDHYAPSFRTYELPAEAGAVGDQTGAGKTGDERKTADTDPDSAVKDSSRVVSGRKGSSAIARASPPAAMLRAADAGKSEEHCGGTAPSRDAAACDGPTKERNDVRAATAMTAGGGTVMVTCERGACVQIGTTAQLGLVGSSYTVETWVKLHEYSGDAGEQRDNAILGSDTCAAHQTLHVVLRCANPHFGHYDADCTAAVPVSLNEWHHVACVYDKLVREMSIYMDGRQVCRERSRPPLEGEVQLTVGRYAGGRAFLGDIARLRVWSKALRADQVADAMTTVHPDFHAACALGLVASMESWLSVRAGDAESNDNTVPWVAVGSASPKRAAGLPDAKESGASHAELLSAVKVATTAEAGAEAFRRLLSVYSRGGSGAVPDKQAVVSAAVALKQRLGGWPPEMAALLNNVLRTLFPGDS